MKSETKWCFLKQTTLQEGEETTFTFCTTALEQNDCTDLCKTTVLCTLGRITFNGFSTQFTEIPVDEAVTDIATRYTQFTYINCTT